ncbi:MAG: hypothetical protein AVDCRST_MAG26-280, partial [uncultured Chloroflexia bacterium]
RYPRHSPEPTWSGGCGRRRAPAAGTRVRPAD